MSAIGLRVLAVHFTSQVQPLSEAGRTAIREYGLNHQHPAAGIHRITAIGSLPV